jgi:hypothetical protein
MRHLSQTAAPRIISLLLVIFASYSAALAQDQETKRPAPANDQVTLKALLDEVRLLRLTMQRVNKQTYLTQVTLGRIRIQQERVDRLTRQLETTRSELADSTHAREQLIERIKDLEERVRTDPDEEEKVRNERVLKDLQIEQRQQSEKEQARRERENQLTTQLQAEQVALDELNKRLDKLELEVESSLSEVEPKQ